MPVPDNLAEIYELGPRLPNPAAEQPDNTGELAPVIPIERAIGHVAAEQSEEDSAEKPEVVDEEAEEEELATIALMAEVKKTKSGGGSWWLCACCKRISKLGNCVYTYGEDEIAQRSNPIRKAA